MDRRNVERAIRESGAGAILVEPSVLRRVIRRHRRLVGAGALVPHDGCYALDRAALLGLVDAEDLGRPTDLPAEVVLLPMPDASDERGDADVLHALWRGAFHAHVHLAIARLVERDVLTAAAVRDRIHRIGQTEFDEIRLVLKQDRRLLSTRDDTETYAEFAALYLELRHFEPALLPRIFPGILEHGDVESGLERDLAVAELLARCRPEGAPPLPARAASADDAPGEAAASAAVRASTFGPHAAIDDAVRLERWLPQAEHARTRGNVVRAALVHLASATVAGEAGHEAWVARARGDLRALAARLVTALRPPADPPADAAPHDENIEATVELFLLLAERAIEGHRVVRSVEARVLFELQKACLEAERTYKVVDLVAWAATFGKTPVVRTLAATRRVRIVRRLRRAAERARKARLSEHDARRLNAFFHRVVERGAANVRGELRPALVAALADVGLDPDNHAEGVAKAKLTDELLDTIERRGFFSIGQLRDAVAKNQLKLENLAPSELLRGDALLLADARLARDLDGVYRRGEIYLRGLQKLSSVAFGTVIGRFLTRYVFLPIGAAFMALEGITHVVSPLSEKLGGPPIHIIERWSLTGSALTSYSLALTAALVFALLHSARVREAALAAARALGSALSLVFVRLPRWIATRPWVRAVVRSGAARALVRFGVLPAALAGAVYFIAPIRLLPLRESAPAFAAAFAVVNVALNSRAGRRAQEQAGDWLLTRLRWIRHRFLPSLFRAVAAMFRKALDLTERAIFAVDEWLRFREGENRIVLAAKVVLGFFWFFVAYVVRLYTNLLVEPQVNPIKHFPVVTVSSKIMLPFGKQLVVAFVSALAPVFGVAIATAIAGPTVFLLPGVAGFLVWEFKENYRLYRQNRSASLGPAAFGHHGETMSGLLRPGLHSGTVPKTFAKLRRAAAKSDPRALGHLESLHEVSAVVGHFVERELLALLEGAPSWSAGDLSVRRVDLGANRVRVTLDLAPHDDPCVIHFEEQSGRLLASVAEPGFAAALEGSSRVAFENALLGLYRIAGVDLVREQLEALLGGAPYDVSDEGLVVWPDGHTARATEVIYDLDAGPVLQPTVRGGAPSSPPEPLDGRRFLLGYQPLLWDDWVAAWEAPIPPRLTKGTELFAAARPPAPKRRLEARAGAD
jgi:hypothetical protein